MGDVLTRLARSLSICLAVALVACWAPTADAGTGKTKSSSVERPSKSSKSSKSKQRKKRVAKKSKRERKRERERARQRAAAPIDEAALASEIVASEYVAEGTLDIRDADAVNAVFPDLSTWVHPIVGTEERVSSFPGREFGARRGGISNSRGCGGGHCGTDLHAERGRPIVAVATGIVVRVERRRSGGDGMSGRHVRLRHPDDTFTTYMHMDSVVDDLEIGDEVTARQQLGTLGSTGVSTHTPHLHFSLEIPVKKDNGTGDHKSDFTRWIDAAPFLDQATIVDRAERKHATKPNI